jgi:mevalonate kinase
LLEAFTTVLPGQGVGISTETDIPIGRGMGSSASLAVATVRAHASAQGMVLDEATLHRQAFAIEKVFHGTPSGVDHSVIARGGAARFQRTETGTQLTPLACPPLFFVIFDTGVAGSTRDLVAGVRSRRAELSDTLEAMGQLTEQVITALRSPGSLAHLGSLLTDNHRLLRALGVSTGQLDALVDFALGHGALGAKLSGAGGGGVVLALAPSPETLLEHARKAGLTAFSVDVVPPAGSQT